MRRAWLATAAVAVVAVAFAFWQARRPDVTGQGGGSAVRVGVADGDSIVDYVAAGRAELASLTGAAFALVSFTDYRTPAGTATLLDGVEGITALARVPIPRRQTELTRFPAASAPVMTAAMARLAERADADPAEAAAYRTACACVYAVVVRGSAAALTIVAGRPGVRVVDPAPEVSDLGRAVFVAPLPEQAEVVAPPPDDPEG